MERRKLLERFHLSRACCWIGFGIYVFAFNPPLGRSVPIVLGLSLYANFGADIASWQAARAERRSIEKPRSRES